MNKIVAIQGDHPSKLNLKTDTSIFLAEEIQRKKYKIFYGMSSDKAQEKHFGKMNSYRASEGRVVKIPYKGSIHTTIQDFLGGLRSTCSYINAKTIKQMPKCTTFVKVSQQVNTLFV